VRALLEQELTFGAARDTQDTRFGIEARPWSGADLRTSVQRQHGENAERLFATTGLTQQWRVDERWLLDFGADRVQTLVDSGTGSRDDSLTFRPGSLLASGSSPGVADSQDFTALFAGFGYRHEHWDVASRLEFHTGERADKWNALLGASHQLAAGKVFSTSLAVRLETLESGERQDQGEWRLGLAWRPAESPWTFLNRLDLSVERQRGGGFRSETGKAVNNFNANYTPDLLRQWSLYLGLKYTAERIADNRFDGLVALAAAEHRRGFAKRWDLGWQGAVLGSTGTSSWRYSAGASVGRTFGRGLWLSLGYNVVGFEDRDFHGAEYRTRGPYLKLRLKMDAELVRGFLGYLGQNRAPLDLSG
jgi:hypothetical protein